MMDYTLKTSRRSVYVLTSSVVCSSQLTLVLLLTSWHEIKTEQQTFSGLISLLLE
jgi:hypothetical protein